MTQKAIGPSFYSELVAYGAANNVQIIGEHFSWGADGSLCFFTDTPAAVISAVQAVYEAHNPATIPLSMQAATMLATGLKIASTSTPALNGVYAVDPVSQADIVAIETSLNAGKGFPGGGTTMTYLDVSRVPHTFSEANLTNFAAAVRDYVYALKSVMAGSSMTLPAASTTIA